MTQLLPDPDPDPGPDPDPRQRAARTLGGLLARLETPRPRRSAQPRSPGQTAAWLRSKPWVDAPIPQDVADVPTMLGTPERALLYVLARDHVRGDGAIIDAGCFLGGSTIALASGLAENPRGAGSRPIQTYDLFTLEQTYIDSYPGLVGDIPAGQSMRPRFEELLGPLLEYVSVNEGDICERRWTGEPIEVLFIDICKSWAINDHVTREFFPALIPGHSVVIQQDLVHEWLPYLHITMGLFADSFDLIDSVPFCSAVYLNTRKVSITRIPNSLRDELTPERKLDLFDTAVAPFTGEDRGVIECSRAVLLSDLGRHADALAHLNAVVSRHPDFDRVQHIGRDVGGWLAAQS